MRVEKRGSPGGKARGHKTDVQGEHIAAQIWVHPRGVGIRGSKEQLWARIKTHANGGEFPPPNNTTGVCKKE